MDLSGLTVVQLLEEHNRLVDREKHLKAWRGKTIDLAAIVGRLRAEEDVRRRRVSRTIKEAAYQHLLHVDFKEDHTQRDVGLSYEEILHRLKGEFPDCETTDKCLRWYAVQLNTDGAKLPAWRPRKPPKRQQKRTAA